MRWYSAPPVDASSAIAAVRAASKIVIFLAANSSRLPRVCRPNPSLASGDNTTRIAMTVPVQTLRYRELTPGAELRVIIAEQQQKHR
jgi:hypothetical protein